ncbi:MAG: hypothetical protein M1818_005798 [Claussenomyces sp. TS43310]|nr:MAG: hypothetical protein M1818_005798 [Claussenomyces sp. TS43310]
MARSFGASLNELFKIDSSIADLDFAVEQKKKAVSSQTSELEALEARLRATEERLKQRQAMTSPSNSSGTSRSPRQRLPLGDAFANAEQQQRAGAPQHAQAPTRAPPVPAAAELEFRPKTPTRPATAKRDLPSSYGAPPPMPGALPPTPSASEGEYARRQQQP